MQTRHGLPTVELGEPGEDRRHLTAQVLARGAGTLLHVRHTAEAAGAVSVGDRLLLVDHAGRNAAVLEVDAVEETTTAGPSRPGTPSTDADRGVPLWWVASPPDRPEITAGHRDSRTPVSCIGFRVVGHETAHAWPGQAAPRLLSRRGSSSRSSPETALANDAATVLPPHPGITVHSGRT